MSCNHVLMQVLNLFVKAKGLVIYLSIFFSTQWTTTSQRSQGEA
jgi:hypothetical protein